MMSTGAYNWPQKVRDITPYLILSHTCSLALAQMWSIDCTGGEDGAEKTSNRSTHALKSRKGGSTITVHARACDAVMAIMKDESCTTKEALESLKKNEESLGENEEKLAQSFMGWLNKR